MLFSRILLLLSALGGGPGCEPPCSDPAACSDPPPTSADSLMVSYARWDTGSGSVVTEKKSLAEVLCATRSGVWDGAACHSPLAYGTVNLDRLTTDQAANQSCPTIAGQQYVPADCWTAMHLLRTWRLLPDVEAIPIPPSHGHAWCTGSPEDIANSSDWALRGAPGFWGSLHNAPMVCPVGQALAADQVADGIPAHIRGYRPHLYCVDVKMAARWLCMAPRMP